MEAEAALMRAADDIGRVERERDRYYVALSNILAWSADHEQCPLCEAKAEADDLGDLSIPTDSHDEHCAYRIISEVLEGQL